MKKGGPTKVIRAGMEAAFAGVYIQQAETDVNSIACLGILSNCNVASLGVSDPGCHNINSLGLAVKVRDRIRFFTMLPQITPVMVIQGAMD